MTLGDQIEPFCETVGAGSGLRASLGILERETFIQVVISVWGPLP